MKYRGKIKDGKWVYGYHVKATHHWHNRGVHKDWIIVQSIQNGGWFTPTTRYPIDNTTLCESTRLNDKNDKVIFTGDIIKQDKNIWSIIFYNGSYRAVGANNDDVIDLNIINNISEIIGNIYDNKELLYSAENTESM